MILSLEHNLISRLTSLHKAVKKYRNDPDRKSIDIPGDDELSSLAAEINQTLHSLTKTQSKLNGHLEFEKMMVEISTKFINLPVNKIDQNIQQAQETIAKHAGADRSHILIFNNEDKSDIKIIDEWKKTKVNSNKQEIWKADKNSFKWLFQKLRAKGSVIISKLDDLPDEASAEREMLENNGILSALCTPIKIGGNLIGLITLEMTSQIKDWEKQIPLMLEIIADVIANAIDRRHNEQHLRLSEQYQYRLNQITKTSIEKDSYNSSVRTLSKHLRSLIESDRGFLFLANEDGSFQLFDSGRKINPDQKLNKILQHLIAKSSKGYFIFNTINDQKEDPSCDFDMIGKSFIVIPLEEKDQNLGLVILAYKNDHKFTDLERGICQQAATQITLAIIKVRALEEAQQISRELQKLRETVVDIAAKLELRELANAILKSGVNLLKADGGELLLYNEKSKQLKVAAVQNLDPNYLNSSTKIGEGAAGKAIQSKKSIYVEDYSTWNNRQRSYDDSPIKSTITNPMMIGERVIGCIGLFHFNANRVFTKNDQNLLTIYTQHASVALDNAMMFERIQKMARMDEVTGLMNRRALNEIGQYEIARANRLKRPISVAMVDLDNYKQVNDSYSHIVGDKVLKEIARILRENVRNIDIVGRYGGDECVIIMPETDAENAIRANERIRNVLETTTIVIDKLNFHLTACFGISSYEENPPQLEVMIEEADKGHVCSQRSRTELHSRLSALK